MATLLNNQAVASRADIAQAINSALGKFAGVANDVTEAREAFMAESATAIGEREKLLRELASKAHAGKWSGDDTAECVKDALKSRNSKSTSISTFAAEIKRACSQSVRANVGNLFDLAREAFDAEAASLAEDKKAPAPLRKAFARYYHAVVQYGFKAAADGRVFADASDFVRFAMDTIRARQIDYKRVKARLDGIRKELQSFADDFPVDGITSCVEFLQSIEVDELRDCVVPKAAPAADDEPEQDDERVSSDDLLEDVLGDMKAQAA